MGAVKRPVGRPSKLSPAQRADARRRFLAGEASYKALQEEYGVGLATLHRAIRGAVPVTSPEENGHDE